MRLRLLLPLLIGLLAAPLVLVAPASAVTVPPVSSGAELSQYGRVLDRANVRCTRGSRMKTKLERDGRRWFEVDAEIYGPPRKQWTIKIKQNGRLKHTVRLRGDSDGELDTYRYLRNRPGRDRVVVKARSAAGERCVARLRP